MITSQNSPSLCPVFFSVLALLNLRLHRCVKLLILASSSLRVSSSDHSLPRRRRTVVIPPRSANPSPYTPPRSANPSPYTPPRSTNPDMGKTANQREDKTQGEEAVEQGQA